MVSPEFFTGGGFDPDLDFMIKTKFIQNTVENFQPLDVMSCTRAHATEFISARRNFIIISTKNGSGNSIFFWVIVFFNDIQDCQNYNWMLHRDHYSSHCMVFGGARLHSNGFCRFPAGMLLASGCSAAISAACHAPADEIDASLKPANT